MTHEKPDEKPLSPWKLTPGRIVMLLLGALMAVYIASAFFGGLTNYENLRDAARPDESRPMI